MGGNLTKFSRQLNTTGRVMGTKDGLAFGIILLGYMTLLGLHTSSFLVCSKEISQDTMNATAGLSTSLLILILIPYAILVYQGKCGGWNDSEGKKVSAFIWTGIMLALGIANMVIIWMAYAENEKKKSDGKNTTTPTPTPKFSLSDYNTYNWVFAAITLVLVLLCFWYFGFQVNDIVEQRINDLI